MPKFKTEAEEAQWWYDNREKVEDTLINAMDNGTSAAAPHNSPMPGQRGLGPHNGGQLYRSKHFGTAKGANIARICDRVVDGADSCPLV